ncbi:hypothetical protein [Daejeonia sp. YH14]|uniref:hypothetical protein n=1 Tax=Daejeonia sp. YH14 TaxID=3439042 RepID=UPI003F499508
MVSEQIKTHIASYISHNQIIDAAKFLLHSYGVESDGLEGFGFRNDDKPNFIVVTTEGEIGDLQTIMIPKNLFNFDLSLVLNLLAHEMLHVIQKTQLPYVEDKNEREWQAYTEMLFHHHFRTVPDAPDFNRKQFCAKALEYYNRMGEGSELQQKYAGEKKKVEQLLGTFH